MLSFTFFFWLIFLLKVEELPTILIYFLSFYMSSKMRLLISFKDIDIRYSEDSNDFYKRMN